MNKTIEEIFIEETERLEQGLCPVCAKPVDEKDMPDDLSLKEFQLSGLCKSCQDKMFGV